MCKGDKQTKAEHEQLKEWRQKRRGKRKEKIANQTEKICRRRLAKWKSRRRDDTRQRKRHHCKSAAVADWEISPSSERHTHRQQCGWEKERQKFKLNYNAQEKTKGDSWQVRASVCVCVHTVGEWKSKFGGQRQNRVDAVAVLLLCEQMKTNTARQKVHSSDSVCVWAKNGQICTVSQWRVKLEKVQIQRPAKREQR